MATVSGFVITVAKQVRLYFKRNAQNIFNIILLWEVSTVIIIKGIKPCTKCTYSDPVYPWRLQILSIVNFLWEWSLF